MSDICDAHGLIRYAATRIEDTGRDVARELRELADRLVEEREERETEGRDDTDLIHQAADRLDDYASADVAAERFEEAYVSTEMAGALRRLRASSLPEGTERYEGYISTFGLNSLHDGGEVIVTRTTVDGSRPHHVTVTVSPEGTTNEEEEDANDRMGADGRGDDGVPVAAPDRGDAGAAAGGAGSGNVPGGRDSAPVGDQAVAPPPAPAREEGGAEEPTPSAWEPTEREVEIVQLWVRQMRSYAWTSDAARDLLRRLHDARGEGA